MCIRDRHELARAGPLRIPAGSQTRWDGVDHRGEPIQPGLLSPHDACARTPALLPGSLSLARAQRIRSRALRGLRGALRTAARAHAPGAARSRGRAGAISSLSAASVVQPVSYTHLTLP